MKWYSMQARSYISVLYVVFLALLVTMPVRAQDTSLHVLGEAVIQQNRYQSEQTGFKTVKPDTLIKKQFNGFNLSDLFSYTNTFFVKSYGGNGIASSSIRGGNAAQNTVNWNGFTLNNPMLGETDLSILPSFFFDDVSTVYGGNACLAGSGSIGGTIYLKNQNNFSNGFKVQAFGNYTSFGNIRTGAGFTKSSSRFINTTRFFVNGGNTNFLYGDTIEGVYKTQRLKHTNLLQYGWMQENSFLLNKNQKLAFHAWLQSSNKQLPNTLNETLSKKSQYDACIRTSADWQLTKERYTLFARSALFVDELDYTDSLSAIYSKSRSLSSVTELETKIRAGSQHIIDAGLNQSYTKGITENYAGNPYLLKYAAFASWQYENRKKWFTSNLCTRQEVVVNGQSPFVWNAGFVIRPFSWATVHGNAGKVFRLPTLNNLYWNPGGNPNLKPEQGYSEEIGLELKKEIKSWNVFFDVTGFNRDINNWIAWLPSGGGIWSPVNILEVWSRGCETQATLAYKHNQFRIYTKTMINYSVSTYQKSINENDESTGRQLIYTPMYSGSNTTVASWKDLALLYNFSYNGYRYLSSDNYLYLQPYWLHNASVNYRFHYRKTNTTISAGVDNLLNRSYQVVASNPMPLRYWKLTLQFQFNK
jgi:iron complex outermembrane receptor protein